MTIYLWSIRISTEREREREREREERERDRQTDRQTDRDIDRKTESVFPKSSGEDSGCLHLDLAHQQPSKLYSRQSTHKLTLA